MKSFCLHLDMKQIVLNKMTADLKLFQLKEKTKKLLQTEIENTSQYCCPSRHTPHVVQTRTNIWSVSVVDVIFHIDKLIYCLLSFCNWPERSEKHVVWKRNDGKYWTNTSSPKFVEREIISFYDDKWPRWVVDSQFKSSEVESWNFHKNVSHEKSCKSFQDLKNAERIKKSMRLYFYHVCTTRLGNRSCELIFRLVFCAIRCRVFLIAYAETSEIK